MERCGFKTSVIVLCFLARNATLTVPLSSQEYKWVLKNCQGNWMKQQGDGVMDQLSFQGGVAICGIQIRQTTQLAWVVLHESRAS